MGRGIHHLLMGNHYSLRATAHTSDVNTGTLHTNVEQTLLTAFGLFYKSKIKTLNHQNPMLNILCRLQFTLCPINTNLTLCPINML